MSKFEDCVMSVDKSEGMDRMTSEVNDVMPVTAEWRSAKLPRR